jgi:hypothetical protein
MIKISGGGLDKGGGRTYIFGDFLAYKKYVLWTTKSIAEKGGGSYNEDYTFAGQGLG